MERRRARKGQDAARVSREAQEAVRRIVRATRPRPQAGMQFGGPGRPVPYSGGGGGGGPSLGDIAGTLGGWNARAGREIGGLLSRGAIGTGGVGLGGARGVGLQSGTEEAAGRQQAGGPMFGPLVEPVSLASYLTPAAVPAKLPLAARVLGGFALNAGANVGADVAGGRTGKGTLAADVALGALPPLVAEGGNVARAGLRGLGAAAPQ